MFFSRLSTLTGEIKIYIYILALTINFFSVKKSLEFVPKGFAISNDELFCIFPEPPATIRVYSVESIAFQREISVKTMNCPCDIVASENVLHVTERYNTTVHRIQLPEEIVSNWTVCVSQFKLSISKNGNVIVASFNANKIVEYTSVGTFVREIVVNRIDRNIVGLQHAIQMEGNKFLVCHTKDKLHRVCMIDNTGRVINVMEEEKDQVWES